MHKKAIDKPIPIEIFERVAPMLRVLAHPHRLKIAELLMERELTVGELADALELAPNACSQHLNLMKAHGLLTAERDGKSVHYRVNHPSVTNLIACIRKHETC